MRSNNLITQPGFHFRELDRARFCSVRDLLLYVPLFDLYVITG